MTGEMAWIKPNGFDSNGDEWPHHAELARRLGGTLCAFDKYQGPYIDFGSLLDTPPHSARPRLWFEIDDNELLTIWREDTDIASNPVPFNDDDQIEAAARALLNMGFIEFSQASIEGDKLKITNARRIRQSDIMACPHVIMVPEHYRTDGTCRCNDEAHTEMSDWGYTWDGHNWK